MFEKLVRFFVKQEIVELCYNISNTPGNWDQPYGLLRNANPDSDKYGYFIGTCLGEKYISVEKCGPTPLLQRSVKLGWADKRFLITTLRQWYKVTGQKPLTIEDSLDNMMKGLLSELGNLNQTAEVFVVPFSSHEGHESTASGDQPKKWLH